MPTRRSTKRPADTHGQPFIGETLREKRLAAGISLGEMARRVKRAKSTLSAVETGATPPSQRLLQAYEKILHLPPESLSSQHNPIAGLLEAARDLKRYQVVGMRDRESLPSRADVVGGVRNSLRRAIAMLAAAAETRAKPDDDVEILISFLGRQDAFNIEPGLHEKWLSALCGVLEAGYRVVHIWHPGESMRQHVDLIKELLHLLNPTWQYEPYYVSGTDTRATAPSDLLIVPHQGALQLFSTYQSQHVDSAFFFPANSPHYDVLRRHFTLRQAHADPLLRAYTARDFDEVMLTAEQQEGEELLLLNNISFKLIPGYVHAERVRRIVSADTDTAEHKRVLEMRLQRALNINEQRRRRFEERLREWPVYHIGVKQTLENMVRAGAYTDAWVATFGSPAQLTAEEITACMHQTIHDLQTFPHYELVLSAQESDIGSFQTFWEVIGDHTALFATRLSQPFEDTGEHSDTLYLATHVPVVVQAMRDFFFRKWQALLPEERDTSETIAWLQALIT